MLNVPKAPKFRSISAIRKTLGNVELWEHWLAGNDDHFHHRFLSSCTGYWLKSSIVQVR